MPPEITPAMRALVESIDGDCDQTRGHGTRVGLLAARTGRALGLPLQQQAMLELAGLLHDVGKLGLPTELLSKPGRLSHAEFELVRHHPRMGHQLLAPIGVPRPVLDAVLHHHENHDGSGYPHGLRGAAIPLTAQIIHVADVFDALTSPRAYRSALTSEAACDLLLRGSGRVTQPVVTLAFLRALARLRRIEPRVYARWFAHVPAEAVAQPARL
ncbi:MAG: HD domain-containing protein [Phycisphaerae bacterium]|jgi:HD-GYP domain-containing protein (c-di-GMP phosphodiesterase class II)